MARVLRTSQANRDLLAIWTYAAEGNLQAADDLLEAINRQCELLAEFPQMGRRRDDLEPSLRSFPSGDYVIFYWPIDDGIEVIRVLHGARDIDGVFNR